MILALVCSVLPAIGAVEASVACSHRDCTESAQQVCAEPHAWQCSDPNSSSRGNRSNAPDHNHRLPLQTVFGTPIAADVHQCCPLCMPINSIPRSKYLNLSCGTNSDVTSFQGDSPGKVTHAGGGFAMNASTTVWASSSSQEAVGEGRLPTRF